MTLSFLEELKSYIGFTDQDAKDLSEFRPLAAPSFSTIADEFYAFVRMHEGALAVLRDEAQARRLHASLRVWLDELLSGPYDEAYVARHGRIGQVHVRVGLPQHYMVTAMSRVRASLRICRAGSLLRTRRRGAGAPALSSASATSISRSCSRATVAISQHVSSGFKRSSAPQSRVSWSSASVSWPKSSTSQTWPSSALPLAARWCSGTAKPKL